MPVTPRRRLPGATEEDFLAEQGMTEDEVEARRWMAFFTHHRHAGMSAFKVIQFILLRQVPLS